MTVQLFLVGFVVGMAFELGVKLLEDLLGRRAVVAMMLTAVAVLVGDALLNGFTMDLSMWPVWAGTFVGILVVDVGSEVYERD